MTKSRITWSGSKITQVSLHSRRTNPFNWGYGLEHIPFLILYCIVLYFCFQTIGEPYAIAIQELREQGIEIPSHAVDSMIYTGVVSSKGSGLANSALSGGIVREDPILESAPSSTEMVS